MILFNAAPLFRLRSEKKLKERFPQKFRFRSFSAKVLACPDDNTDSSVRVGTLQIPMLRG
jgi:hypothetical protein